MPPPPHHHDRGPGRHPPPHHHHHHGPPFGGHILSSVLTFLLVFMLGNMIYYACASCDWGKYPGGGGNSACSTGYYIFQPIWAVFLILILWKFWCHPRHPPPHGDGPNCEYHQVAADEAGYGAVPIAEARVVNPI
jgi:hypothetical protein